MKCKKRKKALYGRDQIVFLKLHGTPWKVEGCEHYEDGWWYALRSFGSEPPYLSSLAPERKLRKLTKVEVEGRKR